jgi:hypothetical protein
LQPAALTPPIRSDLGSGPHDGAKLPEIQDGKSESAVIPFQACGNRPHRIFLSARSEIRNLVWQLRAIRPTRTSRVLSSQPGSALFGLVELSVEVCAQAIRGRKGDLAERLDLAAEGGETLESIRQIRRRPEPLRVGHPAANGPPGVMRLRVRIVVSFALLASLHHLWVARTERIIRKAGRV